MKIRTWIKYEESYVPPRCRKLRYKECEEYVQINLPETTMDSLQLAFEDTSFFGAGKIYLYRGKLWAQAKLRNTAWAEEHQRRRRAYWRQWRSVRSVWTGRPMNFQSRLW